jgi:T5orf172 domain
MGVPGCKIEVQIESRGMGASNALPHPFRGGNMQGMSAAQARRPRSAKIKTYFIRGVQTGLIKIGKTSQSVAHRLENLQSGSPDYLLIMKFVNEDREDEYHKQFAHLRQHGEWFTPELELLEFINKL